VSPDSYRDNDVKQSFKVGYKIMGIKIFASIFSFPPLGDRGCGWLFIFTASLGKAFDDSPAAFTDEGYNIIPFISCR